MTLSEKDKIICEFQFDKYMRRIIFGTYRNFIKANMKTSELQSLNEVLESGYEIVDLLIGNTDIAINYNRINSKLENLMDSDLMYFATKPLTSKEKLAVFLCDICDLSYEKVARKMGYKTPSSVYKLVESGKKKIKDILGGGNCND